MRPKLSIIIPCYNLGEYLKPCLDSISVQQPIDDVEYIFVNDGSTDGTLKQLRNFCSDRKNCKLINQRNSGVSAARNAALKICEGEYIYLLDGDDILLDNGISLMLAAIKDKIPDLIIPNIANEKCGVKSVSINPLKDGIYTPVELYASCKVFPTGAKLIYRKDIITDNHLIFDENIHSGEVYEFTIRFLKYTNKIKVISSFFCYFILRPTSATHNPNNQKDLSVLTTLKKYRQHGTPFRHYISYWITSFKMLMTFTYNKYARLKLTDNETLNIIDLIFGNPMVIECMKKVAYARNVPMKERVLAIYALMTKVLGYKILVNILKIYEKISNNWSWGHGQNHV